MSELRDRSPGHADRDRSGTPANRNFTRQANAIVTRITLVLR